MLRLGLRAPLVARNYLLLLVLLITETLSDGSIDGIVNVHKSREETIFPWNVRRNWMIIRIAEITAVH